MLFKGAFVVQKGWTTRIVEILEEFVILDYGIKRGINDIKPLPYNRHFADRVMPAKWECHFAIYKASQRPGWYLEAKGTDLYFEFVHELQLLVVALRLEEEIESLCNGCAGQCKVKLF